MGVEPDKDLQSDDVEHDDILGGYIEDLAPYLAAPKQYQLIRGVASVGGSGTSSVAT